MAASLIHQGDQVVTIQIEVQLTDSMLESEERIQDALNEGGNLATQKALEQFDADGSPIQIGSTRLTSKGQEPKVYQTPYGEIEVSRHVYQTSQGGKTFCPLEQNARILITSTPRFAKQVSHKYAEMSSPRVIEDLAMNHHRRVTRCFVQDLAELVGSVAQAKEEDWSYETPRLTERVSTITIGLDGTTVLFCQGGYREAMVGTIGLYDREGERLHTIYLGNSPEYGKETFLARLEREIERIRKLYPQAKRIGIADGASDNWTFLKPHVEEQVIDFYHVTGYLSKAAAAAFPRSSGKREEWMEDRCHRLKHKQSAAARQLTEMKGLKEKKLRKGVREGLQSAITYFENHRHQMNYSRHVKANEPIGSGVTEAACKTLVKQRLCGSGMKWKAQGAGVVISLRALSYTQGRWEQFWNKISRYGVSFAA